MNGSDITAKSNKQIPIMGEDTSISLNKYKMTTPEVQKT